MTLAVLLHRNPFCRRERRRTPISGGDEEPTLRLAEAVQGGGGVAAPIRLRIPPYAPQRPVRYTDRGGGIQREPGALEAQLISRMSVHGGLWRLGGCRTLRSDRGCARRKGGDASPVGRLFRDVALRSAIGARPDREAIVRAGDQTVNSLRASDRFGVVSRVVGDRHPLLEADQKQRLLSIELELHIERTPLHTRCKRPRIVGKDII